MSVLSDVPTIGCGIGGTGAGSAKMPVVCKTRARITNVPAARVLRIKDSRNLYAVSKATFRDSKTMRVRKKGLNKRPLAMRGFSCMDSYQARISRSPCRKDSFELPQEKGVVILTYS